jgi:hypothetical protein
VAQTCTWIGDAGGSDYNWNTANNWHGSVADHTVPVAGDDVILNNAVNCVVNANTAVLNSFNTLKTDGATNNAGLTHVRRRSRCRKKDFQLWQ